MLEGKNVNLRAVKKEDLPWFVEWIIEREFFGEYNPIEWMPETEREKFSESWNRQKEFFTEKKDGTKIGFIEHRYVMPDTSHTLEIGFVLVQSERGKGYCTEAVNLMLDYLFRSNGVARIQAHTDTRNVACQRVLEKTGFKKEGTLRKEHFSRGEWVDDFVYSILREEWEIRARV